MPKGPLSLRERCKGNPARYKRIIVMRIIGFLLFFFGVLPGSILLGIKFGAGKGIVTGYYGWTVAWFGVFIVIFCFLIKQIEIILFGVDAWEEDQKMGVIEREEYQGTRDASSIEQEKKNLVIFDLIFNPFSAKKGAVPFWEMLVYGVIIIPAAIYILPRFFNLSFHVASLFGVLLTVGVQMVVARARAKGDKDHG